MFNRGNNDVTAAANAAGEGAAFDSKIVRLGAPARKNDFLRIAAEEHRNMLARVFNCFVSRTADAVAARGIAKLLSQKWQHRLLHNGGNRRGGVVVKENRTHG